MFWLFDPLYSKFVDIRIVNFLFFVKNSWLFSLFQNLYTHVSAMNSSLKYFLIVVGALAGIGLIVGLSVGLTRGGDDEE